MATGGSGGAETGGAGPCEDPGTTRSGGTEYCQNSADDLGNGYQYEFWTAGAGSVCMTVYGEEATFKADWSGSGDFLALVGFTHDPPQTPDQIGSLSSDFAVTGSGTGLVFIGVYGTTDNPLAEYYIIEDWVNDPEGTAPAVGASQGTISVDGGTYTVYWNQLGDGATPLQQYFSIRTEGRQCGRISISEHFSQWADMGMPMGELGRVMLLVEGMQGSGSYEFTRASVTLQ